MSHAEPLHYFDTLGTGLVACPHCTSIFRWRTLVSTCCACHGSRKKFLTLEDLNAWARPGCGCSACIAIRSMDVSVPEPEPEQKPEMTGPPLCGRWNTFRESFEHRRTA